MRLRIHVLLMGLNMVIAVGVWAQGGKQQAPDKSGSLVAAKCDQPGPMRLAMDSEFVYWTDFRGGQVLRAPVGGGAIKVLASQQAGPCGITVDSSTVYWTNNTGGSVMSVPKSGGPPSELSVRQDHPAAIGVGDDVLGFFTGIDKMNSVHAAAMKLSPAGAAMAAPQQCTVHCDLCTQHCTRTVCDPKCRNETYACGTVSCNCRPGC